MFIISAAFLLPVARRSNIIGVMIIYIIIATAKPIIDEMRARALTQLLKNSFQNSLTLLVWKQKPTILKMLAELIKKLNTIIIIPIPKSMILNPSINCVLTMSSLKIKDGKYSEYFKLVVCALIRYRELLVKE